VQRKPVLALIFVGVTAAAAVAFFTLRGPDNSADVPASGTAWLCPKPACGQEFVLTGEQLADHHKANYGRPVSCSKCNAIAVRAHRCVHCGTFFPMQRSLTKCPNCKRMPESIP